MDTLHKTLNFLIILAEVLVIFNLLIIVHELGHFLAARWRGLVVERFGIWFGKPLWKKKIGGVEYSLGSIPAGGFVALPQMAPMEVVEGKNENVRENLPPVSALDKIIVAFAGPLFSMGLAVVFAVIVWQIGRPVAETESTTTIGFVEEGSPAAEAGLKAGDEILAIDGHPVNRFVGMVNSVTWRVIRSEGEKIDFRVKRDGQELTIQSGWTKDKRRATDRAALRQVKIAPAMTPIVGEVEPDGPAAAAGLKPDDIIRSVNGEAIYSPVALSTTIQKNPSAPVALGVERGSEKLSFTITPVPMKGPDGGTMPRIGIIWSPGPMKLIHPSPVEQIGDSLNTMVNMIGALFSPKSDVKAQHFSGPVGIMRLYYLMFESEEGWRMALWFSVLFNVNLAVLNMLPLPVLDGGHIVIAIIESIRRKPVNPKVLEWVTSACAFALIGFMLYVTFFDVQDLPFFKK